MGLFDHDGNLFVGSVSRLPAQVAVNFLPMGSSGSALRNRSLGEPFVMCYERPPPIFLLGVKTATTGLGQMQPGV